MTHFEIRQCTAAACRFRYPWTVTDPPKLRCPRCGATVEIAVTHTLADEAPPSASRPQAPLHALLDNVRSTFNVGSIFRSADGVGLQHLFLCGITPTPHHPKVKKTALGAEQQISWSQHTNSLDLAQTLKQAGGQLWALEESATADSLFAVRSLPPDASVVLVVGNEITGVDPELLATCDRVLTIPMWGIKRSLNVAIAFSIAVYWLRQIPS
jgi:23S rRNA (guanosine2251-2'-O)-methyltransferase